MEATAPSRRPGTTPMTKAPKTKTAGTFTATKVSRNWIVTREGYNEIACYLNDKEVDGWLFRAARSVAEEAAYAAERRADVDAYLARRATRPVSTQLNLF